MSEQQTGWRQVKLGELLTEHSERSISSNQHEVLSVTKDGILSQREYFNKQIASEDNSGYKVVRRGDVVFSAMNLWMGSIDVVKDQAIGIVSPAYVTMRPTEELIDTGYLSYFLRGDEMRRKYVQHSQQGASIVRRNLNKDDLLDDEVCLPPLPEQKKIAEILSGIDRVTNRLSGKLAKQESLLTALLNDQFSSRTESDGALLEDIAEYITYGLTVRPKYVDHGVPMISAGECRNGYLDFAASKKISEDDFANVRSKTIPKQGDLLVTKTGTLGRVAVVPEDCPKFTITQNVALIRPLHNAVRSEYLSYYLRSPVCQKEIRDKTSVLAIPDLQLGMLGRFFIPLPSASQQEKASNFLASIEHYIALIRKELDALLCLQQSVASDLLSGRKRVTV